MLKKETTVKKFKAKKKKKSVVEQKYWGPKETKKLVLVSCAHIEST